MRNIILWGLIIIVFNLPYAVFGQSQKKTIDDIHIEKNTLLWKIYQNEKYGYEIKYPIALSLKLTGLESERDGSSFYIAFREVAVSHGLSVGIYPEKTLQQLVQEWKVPELQEMDKELIVDIPDTAGKRTRKWVRTVINDKQAIKMVDNLQSGVLQATSMMVLVDGLQFHFFAAGSFNQKIAEKIISTFKFYE